MYLRLLKFRLGRYLVKRRCKTVAFSTLEVEVWSKLDQQSAPDGWTKGLWGTNASLQ
jgi:hypothetical protein